MGMQRRTVIVHDDTIMGKGVEGDPIRRCLTIYSEDGSTSLVVPPPMSHEDDWIMGRLWELFGGDA